MTEQKIFEYTYSAPKQEEVRKIREKYLPKEVTKLDQLRALDAGVTRRGNAISIVHGIVYALILGLGMSCTMVWAGNWFVPGIVIGFVGLVGIATTIPLYRHVVRLDREKAAPEILRLSEELILGEAAEPSVLGD